MRNTDYKILHGNAEYVLQKISQSQKEQKKYRLVVTSPPYFQQRNYGCSTNELGQEKTVEEYLDNLVNVFAQCKKMLKDDGSLCIVIGDKRQNNAKLMIPHRLAIKLVEIGYTFQDDIIWYKKNAISSSSKISLTSNYEIILFLSKNKKPYLDIDAVRVKGNEVTTAREPKEIPSAKIQYKSTGRNVREIKKITDAIHNVADGISAEDLPSTNEISKAHGYDPEKFCPTCHRKFKRHATRKRVGGHTHYPIFSPCNAKGKNPGNVWEIATKAHRGNEHFAIFPEALVAKIIKFTTKQGDHILDPFAGRGTTGIVAACLKRKFTGIDLYFENVEKTKRNVKDVLESKISKKLLDQIIDSK